MFHLAGMCLRLRSYAQQALDSQRELRAELRLALTQTMDLLLARVRLAKLVSLDSCSRRMAMSKAFRSDRSLAPSFAPVVDCLVQARLRTTVWKQRSRDSPILEPHCSGWLAGLPETAARSVASTPRNCWRNSCHNDLHRLRRRVRPCRWRPKRRSACNLLGHTVPPLVVQMLRRMEQRPT